MAGKIPDSQDVTCTGLSLTSPLGAEEVYGTVGYDVMASAFTRLGLRGPCLPSETVEDQS